MPTYDPVILLKRLGLPFNKSKGIIVTPKLGTPTISKAQCFKIVDGDDTTSGYGDIVLDWTNISSENDIAVYDENDDLLDYCFEEFDTGNNTAVIWVYRDWVRDGSTQAKIAYGDGPSDQSVSVSTVFDKDSDLKAGYLFNESSGDALDVTSNDNDGTLNGGVTQEATGIVGDAYEFDGTNDYVSVNNELGITNKISMSAWVYITGKGDNSWNRFVSYDDFANDGNSNSFYLMWDEDDDFRGCQGGAYVSGDIALNEWVFLTGTWDGTDTKYYENGILLATGSLGSFNETGNNLGIGSRALGTSDEIKGKIDNVRIYDNTLSSDEVKALYDATKTTQDFFGQGVAEIEINEYVTMKSIYVTSISGTPTISKAQCFKIVDGDDSTTGTGDIVLDWTNISDEDDIAVYDENNYLLDYSFEEFDAVSKTAIIWIYRDWIRDGTEQARIAYGDGPSDQSVSISTVFDKDSDLDSGWLLNESSGDALDVTSNDNDGTVSGATQGEDGMVGDAYDFDGTNDYIEIDGYKGVVGTTQRTTSLWYKSQESGVRHRLIGWGLNNTGEKYVIRTDAGHGDVLRVENAGGQKYGSIDVQDSVWHHLAVVLPAGSNDVQDHLLYVDGILDDDTGGSSQSLDTASGVDVTIGIDAFNYNYTKGLIDNVRIYDKALSSDEVLALYDATKSCPDFFSQEYVWSERPIEWINIPCIASGEEVVYLLFPLYDDTGQDNIAFECEGDYTVDWGDGTTENINSGVTAEHEFDYDDFDDTTLYDGYRQTLIKITPQAGENLTVVDLQYRHSDNDDNDVDVLDIVMNIPNVTGSGNLGIGSDSTQNVIVLDKAQRIWIKEIGAVTNMFCMFNICRSLLEVPIFDTSSATTTQKMFANCDSLETVPLFDTSSVTDMGSMFSRCYSLQSVPLFVTSNVTDMEQMFYSCESLPSVPLFDTSSVTTMEAMFSGCDSLTSVPLFDTSSVTNMKRMFKYTDSLETVEFTDVSNVTNTTETFDSADVLEELILPGLEVSFDISETIITGADIDALGNSVADMTGESSPTLTLTTAQASGATTNIWTNKNWTLNQV